MTILGQEVNSERLVEFLSKLAQYLSNKLNLIQYFWSQRFSPDNMIPHLFGTMVTGVLDTSGMTSNKSVLHPVKKRSYNGKYKEHVMKLQIVTDLLGRVIWFSGPHPGSDHDTVIWKHANPISAMHPLETFLADKAYIGQQNITGQFKKSKNNPLTEFKNCWNCIHGYFRVTVEHSIGFARVFGYLRQKHRGHIGLNPKSTNRYWVFTRFIFEVCNLHWTLQEKQRRTLAAIFIDSHGNNVLPRMDDSAEILQIRRRMHKRAAKFFNSNMIITKNHIKTGFEPSSFSVGDSIWYFRIQTKTITRATIWSITRNKEDATNPNVSVRTSTGPYEPCLGANMLIPTTVCDEVPDLSDFILTRDDPNSKCDSNTLQTRSSPDEIRKRAWSTIKHNKALNKKSTFRKASSSITTRKAQLECTLAKQVKLNQDGSYDSDLTFEEYISETSSEEYTDTSSSESEFEEDDDCEYDEEATDDGNSHVLD